MCTTLQMVSITAHISTDTFPIDAILQQVLRVLCADNPHHRNGKYTGDCEGREGGVMLSSPQQPLGLYSSCSNARTLVFTPSFFVCIHDDLNRFACVFGTHPCVNLLLVFSVCSCILYVCLICINYICISYSSMFLC